MRTKCGQENCVQYYNSRIQEKSAKNSTSQHMHDKKDAFASYPAPHFDTLNF